MIMYALTTVHLAQKYHGIDNDQNNDLYNNARNFLDRGIHSCQQWWASKRPWYSPDMIIRGLAEILLASVNAKRSIPSTATDIIEAMELIFKDMLEAQNKIISSL